MHANDHFGAFQEKVMVHTIYLQLFKVIHTELDDCPWSYIEAVAVPLVILCQHPIHIPEHIQL